MRKEIYFAILDVVATIGFLTTGILHCFNDEWSIGITELLVVILIIAKNSI